MMQKTETTRGKAPSRHGGGEAVTPNVTPVLPLLLLETMRDMDRPEEVLEGENVAVSMPRRLGLSDVIYTQIHRFREEVKRKRLQSPPVVEDLIRLVIRRPDAEEIFEEAGRRLATRAWEERSATSRRLTGLMPAAVRQRSARRAAEKLFRQVLGDGTLKVGKKPLAMVIGGALTVRADPGGAACKLYSGLLSEVVTRYTGRKHDARHDRCAATGGGACEWTTAAQA
ncbi:MAG TPA: hypothetical protein VFE05_20005 [Longimicrobiaceae bacterium]|jgi:predicted hydrocarbon binding protein|nr:hypothetical protein [Longimicrobiaceae bacterium]